MCPRFMATERVPTCSPLLHLGNFDLAYRIVGCFGLNTSRLLAPFMDATLLYSCLRQPYVAGEDNSPP